MTHALAGMTMGDLVEATARGAWPLLPVGATMEDASRATRALGEPTLHHLVAEISRILRGAEQATGDPCH